MIIWCVSNNILGDQNTYLIESWYTRPSKTYRDLASKLAPLWKFLFSYYFNQGNVYAHKYEVVVNIFNENFNKYHFWAFSWMSHCFWTWSVVVTLLKVNYFVADKGKSLIWAWNSLKMGQKWSSRVFVVLVDNGSLHFAEIT